MWKLKEINWILKESSFYKYAVPTKKVVTNFLEESLMQVQIIEDTSRK